MLNQIKQKALQNSLDKYLFYSLPYSVRAPEKEKLSNSCLRIGGTIIIPKPDPDAVKARDKAFRLSKYGAKAVRTANMTIPLPIPVTDSFFASPLVFTKIATI